MKRSNGILLLSTAALVASFNACSSGPEVTADAPQAGMVQKDTSLTDLKFTVEDAPEWTALFNRKKGWIGGDGIFAIPLSGVDSPGAGADTTTMLLFSDTLIGEIEENEQGEEEIDFQMINNTVAMLRGVEAAEDKISFHWASDEAGKPKTVFIPNTPKTQPGEYYWLGDGFVNRAKNGDTYIFGYRIRNTEAETFGFEEVGNTLIIIPAGSKPPFENQRQIDTPFYFTGDTPDATGSFGAGLFVNTKEAGAPDPDGYLYVYGVRGKAKEVLVARVEPANIENFDQWRFWDGSSWQPDMHKAAAIANRASNEMSVTPLPDGRYAMVFQTDGIGRTVGLRLGLSPHGPFGPIIPLWDASADVEVDKDFISYNAKVHNNLSKPGELLISYNINSFDFFKDIEDHPNLYRPRFIRVKLGE
jgi:hypothetical protein